jgi:hypothetical protein
MKYGVVLFHTTSAVMRAEKILKANNVSVKLIPTPRQFSSDCGLALRFDWDNLGQISKELDAAHIEVNAIYEM